MYHIFFIHSIGCFYVLAIVNSAAVNIGVHVSFWIMDIYPGKTVIWKKKPHNSETRLWKGKFGSLTGKSPDFSHNGLGQIKWAPFPQGPEFEAEDANSWSVCPWSPQGTCGRTNLPAVPFGSGHSLSRTHLVLRLSAEDQRRQKAASSALGWISCLLPAGVLLPSLLHSLASSGSCHFLVPGFVPGWPWAPLAADR